MIGRTEHAASDTPRIRYIYNAAVAAPLLCNVCSHMLGPFSWAERVSIYLR